MAFASGNRLLDVGDISFMSPAAFSIVPAGVGRLDDGAAAVPFHARLTETAWVQLKDRRSWIGGE
jgi:hypothetical protein